MNKQYPSYDNRTRHRDTCKRMITTNTWHLGEELAERGPEKETL